MNIRPWQPTDAASLEPLVEAYLTENAKVGGDILPTLKNVQVLTWKGIMRASQGDPVVLAEDNGILGFVLWIAVDTALDCRHRVLQGVGTYVVPAARRTGVSAALRSAAIELGKSAGYDRVDGIAYDERGWKAGQAAGFTSAGLYARLYLNKES